MTDDRDPLVQSLFADAAEDLQDDAFTAAVMARLAKLQRRAILRRVMLAAALTFAALLLAAPVQEVVVPLVQLLAGPLVAVENQTVAQLILPFNTVAFPLALGLLVLRAIRRRLFA